jgi:hypothetical protein
MQSETPDTAYEADVRFLGYRLEVIRKWPPSDRKAAAAEAVSQRLASIARSALVRPDIEDLLRLSCHLLDDLFAEETAVTGEGAMDHAAVHHAAVHHGAVHHESWRPEPARPEEFFDKWEVY